VLTLGVAVVGVAMATLAGPALGAGQRAEDLFARANEAYFQGRYDEAAQGYRTLLESGIDDPDVHFNLATAYARQERFGRAILHFERTLAREPGDEAAQEGLAAAHDALGRERAEAEGDATVASDPPLGEALVRPLSVDLLAWLLLLFDGLFFGLLLVRSMLRNEAGRLGTGIAAPVALGLCVLAGGGLAIKTGAFSEGRPAIVLTDRAAIREGPDPRADLRAEAREGERGRIVGRSEDYVRVRFGAGRRGWMDASDIDAI
jgi:tetratricopeptide (TPR) repeat protein